jgi:cell division septation protein DedD
MPTAPDGAAAGTDALTYPQRLQGDKPVPETLKPESAPPVAAEEPPPAPAAESADGWVVQVAALRDRDAAMAIVKRLSDKKYPAFLLAPAPGAPAPVYRVRVGRFPDRAEAEQIARRLEREEQFKPLITR